MTTQPDLAQLNRAFADEELRTFVGQGGKPFTYIEDETVMDVLDAAFGIGNWQVHTEAVPVYEGVVKVALYARINNEWIWHEDFGYPNNGTSGQALKEAVSDGIRRCGRFFGIARDLYRKDTPPASQTRQNGHSAPPRPQVAPTPIRSQTDIPEDIDDLDWDKLSPAPAPNRAEGTMWSKELFTRAEAANIDKRAISDTAKKMYGKDKWKVTDLTDGERFALAVELGVA